MSISNSLQSSSKRKMFLLADISIFAVSFVSFFIFYSQLFLTSNDKSWESSLGGVIQLGYFFLFVPFLYTFVSNLINLILDLLFKTKNLFKQRSIFMGFFVLLSLSSFFAIISGLQGDIFIILGISLSFCIFSFLLSIFQFFQLKK